MPFDQRDSWHLARSACAADWQANNRVVNFSGWAGQHGADGTCSCSCSTCTTYLTELKQPLAVQAIVRPWRLSHVVAELSKVGIYGLTATRVRGAGVQGGELRGGSVYLWAASPVSVQCQISACTLQQALGCKEAAKAIERMYSRLSAGLLPQASLSHTDCQTAAGSEQSAGLLLPGPRQAPASGNVTAGHEGAFLLTLYPVWHGYMLRPCMQAGAAPAVRQLQGASTHRMTTACSVPSRQAGAVQGDRVWGGQPGGEGQAGHRGEVPHDLLVPCLHAEPAHKAVLASSCTATLKSEIGVAACGGPCMQCLHRRVQQMVGPPGLLPACCQRSACPACCMLRRSPLSLSLC